MRYEEDLLESKLLNTIKTIKTIVWEYAGDDVPKLRDHLQYYVEFDCTHKQEITRMRQGKMGAHEWGGLDG